MNIMECIAQIKENMALLGWRGRSKGLFTHKIDADGQTVARHHDATWLADMEEAIALSELQMVRRELERRLASSGQVG